MNGVTMVENRPAAIAQLAIEAERRRREQAELEERERGLARCRRIDRVADSLMSLETDEEMEEAIVTVALICYGVIGGMATGSNERIRRVGELLLGTKWIQQGAEDLVGEIMLWGGK